MNTDKDLEIVNLKQRLFKAERQQDEAQERLDEYVEKTEHIRAERDQLIKVVDELADCIEHIRYSKSALLAYSLLPHVKQKKHE